MAVDEFPTDVSVYGLRGMTGNVRDWTATEEGEGEGSERRLARVLRGGAWYFTGVSARCAVRQLLSPTYVSASVGFRWARSVRGATPR